MVSTNVQEDATKLDSWKAQKIHDNLETEKNVPQDKCEEVVPHQCLPMEPKQKLSVEEPPMLELKPLPDHLEHAFLGENDTLLVIIAKSLMRIEKRKLMEILGWRKLALGWTIANIRGISPAVVTHHIYTDETKKLVR